MRIQETERNEILIKPRIEKTFPVAEGETFSSIEEELDFWIGEYEFAEQAGSIEEPPAMYMYHLIRIYKDTDQHYYAYIYINGQTTYTFAKARVYGDKKRIDLIFLEYLPEHMIGFVAEKGSLLISFERVNDKLYTYWGEITPLRYDNEESGKVYFEKVK